MLEGWYARCKKVGLIPKEFTLLLENESKIKDPEIEVEINQEVEETNEIPEIKKEPKSKDEVEIDDSVYHNEIKIEDKKSFLEPEIQMKKKKSFHRRRKEEWKRKKSSKQLVVIITEKKEEKKQEKSTYSSFKIGPPNILKITLMTLLAFTLIPLSAANPIDPNGYRPSATKMDFRDVQHNAKLIDHIRDLNYINTTISTIHADHVGVQTFVHKVKFIIDDVENGVDQSCQAISTLSDECLRNGDGEN